ncbi:MAG: DUF5723 family protein [Prolixibacteraceae bacterium]
MKGLKLSLLLFVQLIIAIHVHGQSELNYPINSTTLSFYNHSAKILYFDSIEFSILPVSYFKIESIIPYSTYTMFSKNTGADNYALDFTKMDHRATRMRHLYANIEWNWMQFSAINKKSVWNIFIKEQAYLSAGFQKVMFQFLDHGNKAFLGETVNFSVPVSGMHYRTFGVTWAKSIDFKLDVAVTGKFYSGLAYLKMNPEISVFTEENAAYIDFKMKGQVRSSLPYSLNSNSDGFVTGAHLNLTSQNYFLGSGNPGLGFDVSTTVHLNHKMDAFADVIDFGGILWRKNVDNILIDGDYVWSGLDVSGILNSSNELSLKGLANLGLRDSVLYRLAVLNNERFLTKIPGKVIFGMTYRYTSKLSIEWYNQMQFFNYYIREYFSASAVYKLNPKLQLWSGLTFQNQSYFDIPVGVRYDSRRIMIAMNLNNLWGLLMPDFSRNFGGSFHLTYRFNISINQILNPQDLDGAPFFEPYEDN